MDGAFSSCGPHTWHNEPGLTFCLQWRISSTDRSLRKGYWRVPVACASFGFGCRVWVTWYIGRKCDVCAAGRTSLTHVIYDNEYINFVWVVQDAKKGRKVKRMQVHKVKRGCIVQYTMHTLARSAEVYKDSTLQLTVGEILILAQASASVSTQW